jgi:hypothetical protein
MEPDRWFEQLAAHLPPGGVEVSDDERDALLDLARVAAHTSERWTAPVTTFLAGVAYASTPAAERARALQDLVHQLEGAP